MMIDTEILQDIYTDHDLCGTQRRELVKVIAMIKQNRLIELPCAVGDKVYVVTACENVVMNHDTDYFTGTGAIECPYEGDCPYADCGDENKRVFETYCRNIYLDEDGLNIILEDFAFTATLEDFGKTVFLIKEEAEAKLKELEE